MAFQPSSTPVPAISRNWGSIDPHLASRVEQKVTQRARRVLVWIPHDPAAELMELSDAESAKTPI